MEFTLMVNPKDYQKKCINQYIKEKIGLEQYKLAIGLGWMIMTWNWGEILFPNLNEQIKILIYECSNPLAVGQYVNNGTKTHEANGKMINLILI